jgi:hypothetical protein
MKVSEFRKLIREEVRKVVNEYESRIISHSNKNARPLGGLFDKFDAYMEELDEEAEVLAAWAKIPKQEMQTSYDKLLPSAQKQFESLLKAALTDTTSTNIFALCTFIVSRNTFPSGVVRACQQILRMQ